MKKLLFKLIIAALVVNLISCGKVIKSDGTAEIIPKPVLVGASTGVFTLTQKTKIVLLFNNDQMPYATNMINDVLNPILGKELKVIDAEATESNAINISQNKELSEEEYTLLVSPDQIEISASTAQGIFYAFETLRQLIPVEAYTAQNVRAIELPAVQISDKPFFGYRGMLFDVCRHFYSVDEVKKTLDILALHKMNRFHWHLTEDQGWRIEIKKYPKLTEVGSIRKETVIGHNTDKYDGKPYGGYYTQEDIRDIVQYAKERFITIIPEIEIPGHSVAALTAYPYLGCRGEGYEVMTKWGVSDQLYCPGKETTFEFIEDVLTEVMDLFPSEYIHIGGDECPKTEWEKCPNCQALIKRENLEDEKELQGYVTRRVEKFLNEHNRKIIGWDEILEGGVTKNATIMSWRGSEGGIEAAKKGNNAIMSPHTYCYLDYYQSKDIENEPVAIGGYLPVERVYSLDPYDQLSVEEQRCIIGVQANLWTEYISTYSQVQYMLLPRLSAVAEVGWSYDRKNFTDYKTRLLKLVKVYDVSGYNYAKHILTNEK